MQVVVPVKNSQCGLFCLCNCVDILYHLLATATLFLVDVNLVDLGLEPTETNASDAVKAHISRCQ